MKQFANTLGSLGGMVTHEEESISPTKKHKMRTSQFSNFIQFIITSCLDRQVHREVNIENFQGAILMNRRNEMGGVRVDRVQYRRWGGD